MAAPDRDVLILGGGHNGLVTAAYLARAGLKVLVLERRDLVGGACVTEELFPGFHFSTCSYLCYLLQDRIVEDLELGRHGFEVMPIDPWRFLPLPDGRRLLLWEDLGETQREIARFSKRDAENYPKWLAFWKRAAGILHPWFLKPPPTVGEIAAGLAGTADRSFFEELLRASMKDVVRHFFESDAVQGALIHAHDVGNPAMPGSAWAYAWIKCSMFSNPANVGLVRGGMGGITRALAAAARAAGAELRTGSEVSRVVVEAGCAVGVELADGTQIRARVVVSNADPKRTFLNLVGEPHLDPEFLGRVRRLSTGTAYFKFHAALKGVPDFSAYFQDGSPSFDPRFLAEVKVCPSIRYFEDAWADAQAGRPSAAPVLEVQMPGGYDRSVAPAGQHVLSIWGLFAPSGLGRDAWDSLRRAAGERMIDTIEGLAPGFRRQILDWSIYTPVDIEDRMAMTDGNIRHLDMIPSQLLADRPLSGWGGYATPVRGLYLCGAGTHPGGEVTGAPGHNAAQRVLADLGVADAQR